MKKTPDNILKSNARYNSKLTRKVAMLKNKEDADLIEMINKDSQPFSSLVKSLLYEHYKLNKADDQK